MYSSVAVVVLRLPLNQICHFQSSQLCEKIQKIGYNLHTDELILGDGEENDLKTFRDKLLNYDLVLMIAPSIDEFCKIAKDVYEENQTSKLLERTHSRRYQVISVENNAKIYWTHRLYLIHPKIVCYELKKFVEHLSNLKKRPVFLKVLQFNHDCILRNYSDRMLHANEKFKFSKGLHNEDIVSARSIDAINMLHEHLREYLQSSFVLLNTDCVLNCDYVFVKDAMQHIRECFNKYQPENVFISFNGGKDCTVLLHLMLIVLAKFYPDYKQKVVCMYVQSAKPFAEVTKFIEQMQRFYNLDLKTFKCGIKEGLAKVLDEKPNLKACLMGTRATDPFSKHLTHFERTDNGFPDVMRVFPILHWQFAHIWDYLMNFKVPYCKLYDEGYTSLGNVDDTQKNPCLWAEKDGYYRPAYRLLTSFDERRGRTK